MSIFSFLFYTKSKTFFLIFFRNLEILNIIRKNANQAIRYESHFDKCIALGENVISISNQNHSQFMVHAKKMINWIDTKIENFERDVINKLDPEEISNPRKQSGGFFSKFFSKSPSSDENKTDDETGKHPGAANSKKFWQEMKKKETAFFKKMKYEIKEKVTEVSGLRESDEKLKDLVRYELEVNYIHSAVEDSVFEKFEKSIEIKEEQISEFIKFFNTFPEALKTLLESQKRQKFYNHKLEKHSKQADEFNDDWAREILKCFTELQFSLSMLKNLKNRLTSYFNLSDDITTKNYFQIIVQSKIRELEEEIIRKRDTEMIANDILSKQPNVNDKYDELYRSLIKSIKSYEMQIQTDCQFIRNNFFSLNETEISSFEYNYDKNFESVNKNCLNKLMFDNKLSLDSEDDDMNFDKLKRSISNGTSSSFFKDVERCHKLAKMTIFYKNVNLIIKRVCRIMKSFGVENLAVYTKFRFDSEFFLAFTDDDKSAFEMIKQEWSRDRVALMNLIQKVSKEINNEKVISSNTYSSLLQILKFLKNFSDYVEKVETDLRSEWQYFHHNFKDLKGEGMSKPWNEAREYFDSIKEKNGQIFFKHLQTRNSDYDEFNVFIEE